MSPRDLARGLAFTRLGIGAALIAAPRLTSAGFLGRHARGPATDFYGRATGIRDVVMGALALHTLDHPQVGPRYVATAAAVDAADALAILAVRKDVGAGVILGLLPALGGAVAGAYTARALSSQG